MFLQSKQEKLEEKIEALQFEISSLEEELKAAKKAKSDYFTSY